MARGQRFITPASESSNKVLAGSWGEAGRLSIHTRKPLTLVNDDVGSQMFVRYLRLSISGAGRPPTKVTAAKPLTLVTCASRGFSGEHSFAVTTERASVSPTKNKEIAKLVLGTLFPESTVAGGGHSDVEGLGRIYLST